KNGGRGLAAPMAGGNRQSDVPASVRLRSGRFAASALVERRGADAVFVPYTDRRRDAGAGDEKFARSGDGPFPAPGKDGPDSRPPAGAGGAVGPVPKDGPTGAKSGTAPAAAGRSEKGSGRFGARDEGVAGTAGGAGTGGPAVGTVPAPAFALRNVMAVERIAVAGGSRGTGSRFGRALAGEAGGGRSPTETIAAAAGRCGNETVRSRPAAGRHPAKQAEDAMGRRSRGAS